MTANARRSIHEDTRSFVAKIMTLQNMTFAIAIAMKIRTLASIKYAWAFSDGPTGGCFFKASRRRRYAQMFHTPIRRNENSAPQLKILCNELSFEKNVSIAIHRLFTRLLLQAHDRKVPSNFMGG